MSENLNDTSAELTARLQNADPAAKSAVPHESLIQRAVAQAEETELKKAIRFLKPKNRVALMRSLSTAGVMAVVLGFAAPSILGGLPSSGGYLFDASGGAQGEASMAGANKMSAVSGVTAGPNSDMMGTCVGADGFGCGYTPTEFKYLAGTGLSNATGSAQIFKLVPNRSASQTMTVVASALGITGPTKTMDTPDSTWTTLYKGLNPDGSEGWGKPQLTVSLDNKVKLAQWSYNGNQTLYTDCAHQDDAVKGLEVPIIDPAQQNEQKDLCLTAISGRGPTTSEAVAEAKKLFKEIGFDSSTALANVKDGDLYLETPNTANRERAGVSINGFLKVGGYLTAMSMSVGWDGSSKEISYAYGFDGVAEAQGSFGTVSQSAAVARLGDWQWFGNPYLDYSNLTYSQATNPVVTSDVAVSPSNSSVGGAAVDPAVPADGAAGSTAGSTGATSVNPNGVESPAPAPEVTPVVVSVTVERAKSALMLVYAADGSIWFVPGFVFYDSTGYVGNVLSVVEGVIKLPEPMAIDTGIMVR